MEAEAEKLAARDRRAISMESNSKGPQARTQAAPSPGELNRMSGEPPLPQVPDSKSGEATRSEQDVLPLDNGPKPEKHGLNGNGTGMSTNVGTTKKKRPNFLAKQFGMISNSSASGGPRRSIKILGKEYVTRDTRFAASETKTVPPVPEEIERPDHISTVNEHQHDQKSKRGELAPIESVAAYPPIAITSNIRIDSLSRTASISRRSCSASDRIIPHSQGSSPRSVLSNQSIPETVLSSTDEYGSNRRIRLPSRMNSISSRGEWMSQDFVHSDRHGELGIAPGLSLGEGRIFVGVSQRTDISNADSPARSGSDTVELDYSPDDTNSGVEMYHESTSAGPGSFSSRLSCRTTSSQDWVTEYEDSDHVRHYGGKVHRNDQSSSSTASSQAGVPGGRYTSDLSARNIRRDSLSLRAHTKLSRQLSGTYSFNKRHNIGGHSRDLKRDDSTLTSSNRHNYITSRRHMQGHAAAPSSKVVLLLGKYGNTKGLRIAGLQSGSPHAAAHPKRNMSSTSAFLEELDADVPLDSISPQEAVAVFQDEVARMMLEDRECDELADIQDFLDGYMRLRSPFYLEMVEEFFRAVCFDCYKRPLDLQRSDVDQRPAPLRPAAAGSSCPGFRSSRASSLRSESRRSFLESDL